jgi:ABC-type bacteriocin/lantibiotic exporter with double-glycine peptidase domain
MREDNMNKITPIELAKASHKYHGLSKRKFFKTLEQSFNQDQYFDKHVNDFFKRLSSHSFPSDNKVLIELRDISKQFPVPQSKPNVLFDQINIKIKRGDVISLVGANGVGKSTLLDILVGYLNPTAGNVKFNLEYT